jgi:hypothetical protein
MKSHAEKGVTLLETMLYIGMIGIILPAFTLFVLYVWQDQIGFEAKTRLDQTTSLIFLEMAQEIPEAQDILISTSTLGTDTSALRFTDENGSAVVIELVSTSITFGQTNHTIRRLRMTRGALEATWLTEPEHDVLQWRIDAVRNSVGTLTGLQMQLSVELLNQSENIYRNAIFSKTTTIALSPHTTER